MLTVTIFKPPHGRRETLDIPNVYPDDAAWFRENNVKVSMEEVGGTFDIYGDIGRVDEEGEPDEVLVLASGRSCEDTLKALRAECEKAKKEMNQ